MLQSKFFVCLLAAIIMFAGTSAYGQSEKETAQYLTEMADEVMRETRAYNEAREMYIQASQADPDNIYANYMAGKLYLETVNKHQATSYFLQVLGLDPDYRFDILYLIGRSYQYGNDFDEALDYYRKYELKLEEQKNYRGRDKVGLQEVTRRIEECTNGKEFMANPSHYTIVNVGNGVNSDRWDYAPVLNEDETMMIFTSRRQEGNLNENVDDDNFHFEDIYIAYKEGDTWGEAKNIGEVVNTLYHDSNIALSADGTRLYLYKDDNAGDIYVSELINKEWTSPQPLSANINSMSYAEKSMSVSADNEALFFSSNRPGGKGGLDIYVSTKDGRGEWSNSKNLSDVINTPFDEDSPFIDYDGKTLYFSSNGRKGMGGYDIFKTEYDSTSGEWSEPVNLGYPINTPDNDIYFVSTKDGKRGYYASVREDGMGYTDIYMVTIPDTEEDQKAVAAAKPNNQKQPETETPQEPANLAPVTVQIKVVDNNTGKPLTAKVTMTQSQSRMEYRGQKIEEGVYKFELLEKDDIQYMLSAENSRYMFVNKKVIIPAAEEKSKILEKTLYMKPLEVGDKFILRNVYFDFDRATLQMASNNELNKVVRVMQENPSLKVEIGGHTDDIGSWAYNKKLSQRRANAISDYLVSKGIDPSRVKAVGYGETQPIASNDDEFEGRELNRRVEFEIISNGEE